MNAALLEKERCAHPIREAVSPADTHHLSWLESEAIHILREVDTWDGSNRVRSPLATGWRCCRRE
jgi:hypothetical protein